MKLSGKLNEFDILDLLNEYQSELRKLKYKTDFVRRKVAELEEQYNAVKLKKGKARAENSTNPGSSDEEGQASPLLEGGIEAIAPKGKRGRPRKEKLVDLTPKTRKPYPLSIWDTLILQSLEENGKAMLSKTIIEQVKQKATEAGIFDSEEKLKSKVNQCLVKLANKRNDIKKVNYKGKGFGYALPVWYDEKGKLTKEHMLK
ncbi:MAG: hypothetical protein KGZ82_02005 [Bacteroidales bacterium]|nr:hypothetical protein [Bacteroidales bacterium]